MKKYIMVAALVLFAVNSFAGLRITGHGESRKFDDVGFPPSMKANYDIMKVKCVKCHSLERVVEAISSGVSPISGQPFDRSAVKAYGAKMARKSDSDMNKKEIRATVELMYYLLDQAAR